MSTSHHTRTAGQYDEALTGGDLSVEGLALALGVPVDVAEHDVLKLVELGVLEETKRGRYGRLMWRDDNA